MNQSYQSIRLNVNRKTKRSRAAYRMNATRAMTGQWTLKKKHTYLLTYSCSSKMVIIAYGF